MSFIDHLDHGFVSTLPNGTKVYNTCFFNCLSALTGRKYVDLFLLGGFPEESRGKFVDLQTHVSHINTLLTTLGLTIGFYRGYRTSTEDRIRVDRDHVTIFPEPDYKVFRCVSEPAIKIVCISNHYMTFEWSSVKDAAISEALRAQEASDAEIARRLAVEESERVERVKKLRDAYASRVAKERAVAEAAAARDKTQVKSDAKIARRLAGSAPQEFSLLDGPKAVSCIPTAYTPPTLRRPMART